VTAQELARAASGIGDNAPTVPETANTLYVDAASGPEVTVPDAAFLSNAQYVRHGADLHAADDAGRTIVIRGYFNADPAPDLVTADGARVAGPDLLEPFIVSSTPGQYAQLGAPASGPQIGQVSEMSGRVFAVRADGTRVELGTGDPLYQGDVVETSGDNSAVRILLIDQTTFAIGPDARLALDQLTFNPQDHSGDVSFTMLKGVFIFTSGLVAKHDPTHMTVNTPVALIGIRGTVVTGNLDDLGGQFTVLYGAIRVETHAGSVTMSESGATTQVTNINAPPAGVFVLGPNEYAAIYKAVSGVAPGDYLKGDAPDPNSPGDLGAVLPGDAGGHGSVGQSVAALIGATIANLAAFDAVAQVPSLNGELQQLLDELANGDTVTTSSTNDNGEQQTTASSTTPDAQAPTVFDFSGAGGPVNFVGNDSAEYVLGSAFADNIDTRGGNDTVIGNNGNDVILGGDGDDLLIANNGAAPTTIAHDFVTTAAIPALADGQALDPSQINGVNNADLTLQADNPVSVVFQSEGAGNQNALGYYVVGENGALGDIQFVWTNASAAGSGGDLETGDSVSLDVGSGDTFEFFLVADGASLNDFSQFQNGSFEFRDADGNPATIDTVDPILYFVGADGTEQVIQGNIFHSASASQNADGVVHAVSGLDASGEQLVIGFEDLSGGGDRDYEDLVFSVKIDPLQTPNSDADIVNGGNGNDTLVGGPGDTLIGGNGDDLFQVSDLTFASIDGGAGTDTVQFTGANASFDLTQLAAGQVSGIEQIDLTAADNATLTLDANTVLNLTDGTNALTDTDNTLVVTADAGDQVDLGDGWTESGSTDINGESYTIYQHDSGAQVAVDNQAAVT
jgi:Domain of unknown function (DUF4114)/FecR protein/RTX calcium-binding nonapeptide repeat (4 copies)